MKKMLRGRKRNNRGMSLVEVVVAIAILSIVMLSVLHSFVYSARYNARSRERQQTTAAAQTVMENFKAYSVQEIWDQFQTYDPAIAGSGYRLSGGVGNYYEGAPGGNMKFQITGMQYQNEEYDVSINLTPHGSDASKVNTLVYENPTQEHTAIYVGYAGMDAEALTGIMADVAQEWSDRENAALGGGGGSPAPGATPDPAATSAPAALHSPNEVDSSRIDITRRDLTVDIDNSSGNYVVKVSCVYTYNVTDYPYMTDTYGGTDVFSLSGATYQVDLSEDGSKSKVIFDNDTEVNRLDLYYYPAYRYVPPISGGAGADSPVRIKEDHININNISGTRVKCYIYKQKNMSVSDAKLSTAENVYEVNLHLANADIYDDNLNTVLGSNVGSIVDSKIHVSGGERYHGIGYTAANVSYPSAGNASPGVPLPTAAPAATAAPTVKELQIMYDIEIAIHKSGQLHEPPLSTLEGTIIE